MRKYIFVFKATLIESLQYIINILLGFITFFMISGNVQIDIIYSKISS
jgi:hypothetical protein